MTKGLLYSPLATTELFYISPGRILLLPANGTIPSAPPVVLYMNL